MSYQPISQFIEIMSDAGKCKDCDRKGTDRCFKHRAELKADKKDEVEAVDE